MNNSLGMTRQRQLAQTEEIKRSFKATTNLANALDRERRTMGKFIGKHIIILLK